MTLQVWLATYVRAFVLAAVFASAACSSVAPDRQVSTFGNELVDDSTSVTTNGPGAPTSQSFATSETNAATGDSLNDTSGPLASCEDIPELEGTVEGSLGGAQNPDVELIRIIREYGDEHRDTFAELWIDRAHSGTLVAAFTGDPEVHREALAELLPAGTPFDVVQVEHSHGELEALQELVFSHWAELGGLVKFGVQTRRNRLTLGFVDPPTGALDALARIVPADAVCVEIQFTPEPPSQPLDIIPDLTAEDPLVECRGLAAVRYSWLADPPSINEFDHPAVGALREELRTPSPEALPSGDWSVLSVDDNRAIFAIFDGNIVVGHATFRPAGDRWTLRGWGQGNRTCEARVALPPGLGHVEIGLDTNSLPAPAHTSIAVLVTEIDCSGGREMGDALVGPQVIETDDAVLVAFAVIPVSGGATCPGNPTTRITIQLSEPLGNRALLDGVQVPPPPITVRRDN